MVDLFPGSPAAAAGIRPGDVIVRFGNHPISTRRRPHTRRQDRPAGRARDSRDLPGRQGARDLRAARRLGRRLSPARAEPVPARKPHSAGAKLHCLEAFRPRSGEELDPRSLGWWLIGLAQRRAVQKDVPATCVWSNEPEAPDRIEPLHGPRRGTQRSPATGAALFAL